MVEKMESKGSLVIPSQRDPSELAAPVKVVDAAKSESDGNVIAEKSESSRAEQQ